MLRTQKSTFLNSDFFAKSEIQNIITISKIMKLVQKLNSQQQIEHGGHFYCRHGYELVQLISQSFNPCVYCFGAESHQEMNMG